MPTIARCAATKQFSAGAWAKTDRRIGLAGSFHMSTRVHFIRAAYDPTDPCCVGGGTPTGKQTPHSFINRPEGLTVYSQANAVILCTTEAKDLNCQAVQFSTGMPRIADKHLLYAMRNVG